jgi:hypothetical protein
MYQDEAAVRIRATIQQRIGSRLRNLFVGIQGEPLADEHVEIIMRMRRKERERQRREQN